MKHKKSSSVISLTLSDDELTALTQALLFLLHCDRAVHDQLSVAYDTIASASDKLEAGDQALSRGQLRACIAAARESIRQMSDPAGTYRAVEEIFPELIPDLRESLPVLADLLPRLRSKLS